MNRITAILLAMAALLVHVLVVHRDPSGGFAYAYESAHVAYALGENLAQTGTTFWAEDPATGELKGGLWSYGSPLLVWMAAAFETLSFDVGRAAQIVGILCVLATVFLSTRFDTDRIAGVIPALLLVSSGATAAAGASGTEWPVAMFALATSFAALERGRPRFAALGLTSLVLVRPEGIFAALLLLVLTIVRRRAPGPEAHTSRVVASDGRLLLSFVPAAVAVSLAHLAGASLLSDVKRALPPFDASSLAQGLWQLRDFVVGTVTPLLLVFPVWCAVRENLSGVGRRALVLAAGWCGAAAAMGGGPSAFDIAYCPALPIAFIAIQQGMARILDTYLRSMERLVWTSLALAIFGSILGSRFPGNLGRIELIGLQETLFSARAETPPGGSPLLARSALFSEIQLSDDLRRIGEFLEDRIPEGSTVLSPWPGVLGATMDACVIDAFGRTVPHPGSRAQSWSPDPGAFDTRAVLALEPDYILPSTRSLEAYLAGELDDFFTAKLLSLDPGDGPALRARARARFDSYEIVVTTGGTVRPEQYVRPLLLMRRRGSETPVELTSTKSRDLLRISAGFPATNASGPKAGALPQLFDVQVFIAGPGGERSLVDPYGAPLNVDDGNARTSVGIVIDPRFETPVTLAEVQTGALGGAGRHVEARLLHHRLDPDDPYAEAAPPLVVALVE